MRSIRLLHQIRLSRLDDEHGQSLVLILFAMTVILGMGAFGIDVASWYQKDHRAQVAADAAALATANCMANAGTTTACATTATTFATTNGATMSMSWIPATGTPTAVSVTTTVPAPSFFAARFGIGTSTRRKTAIAAWTTGQTPCATPGNSCAAVFAMSSSCTDGSSDGQSPIIFNGSGDTITGGVHSNGTIDEVGGTQTLGPTTFGNGSGCTIDTHGSSNDTWNGSPTKPSTGGTPITTWPDDFSKVLTACGGSDQPACTGPGGTPSYCTQAAASFTFGRGATSLTSGNVWCAYGSGSPSTPSTWNGLIYFQSCYPSCGSASSPIYGTWFGGTIDLDHNGFYLSTQSSTPTYPVLYAMGSGNCSNSQSGGICMPGQSQVINGALFAPNGEVQFNGAGTQTDNFVEGNYINFIGGSVNITGNGPMGVGGPATGSDSLVG